MTAHHDPSLLRFSSERHPFHGLPHGSVLLRTVPNGIYDWKIPASALPLPARESCSSRRAFRHICPNFCLMSRRSGAHRTSASTRIGTWATLTAAPISKRAFPTSFQLPAGKGPARGRGDSRTSLQRCRRVDTLLRTTASGSKSQPTARDEHVTIATM